jgi:hypothetical protein
MMNSSFEKLLFRFGRFYNYKYQLPVSLWLQRYKETSVFAVAHVLSHVFCISLLSLFYGIPAINYVCNFLPCPIFLPKSYRRGKLCLQNNCSLLILLQQYNFFLYLSNFHLDMCYLQQSRIVTFKNIRPGMFARKK